VRIHTSAKIEIVANCQTTTGIEPAFRISYRVLADRTVSQCIEAGVHKDAASLSYLDFKHLSVKKEA
jgi:hypothetical protein